MVGLGFAERADGLGQGVIAGAILELDDVLAGDGGTTAGLEDGGALVEPRDTPIPPLQVARYQ